MTRTTIPSSIYLSKTQQITINYTSSEVQPLHKNLQLNKPHLFTLKTKVNGHEIKILVDGGSDYTLISNSLLKKIKTEHHGSVTLNIDAVAGCSTTAEGNVYSLSIPTEEGDMHITGHKLNEIPTKLDENQVNDIYETWPNLNDTIRQEAIANRFLGPVDLLIGQDNYWTLVLEGIIKHPSEKFGFIKTKLGWTVGGRISNISPMLWQRDKVPDKVATYS